jgi:hypothetical protein
MHDQLTQMEAAGVQTDSLIRHAEGQVKALTDAAIAARDNATAAKASAESASQTIKLYINKERAKLRIEMSPLALPNIEPEVGYTVEFAVSIHGTTAAFITERLCVAYCFPPQVIDDPELGEAILFPIYPLPDIIPANSPRIECHAFLSIHAGMMIPEIKASRMLVGIRGFIKYRDIFEEEDRITAFRYTWKYNEAMVSLGLETGDWVKSGHPDENKNT